MRVWLLHPEWRRSCADCAKWHYSPDGTIMKKPAVIGLPMLRGDSPTPCESCPKIPDDVAKERRNAIELTDKHWRAWQHWRECRAVGKFPKDALVRRHAAIFQRIQDELEARPLNDLSQLLLVAMTKR